MSSTAVEQDVRPVAAQPTPRDLYRLVVLQKSGAEILVASQRSPFTLPCVEIPRWERIAENLIEAVRKRYGISTICLFTPGPSGSATHAASPLYQVVETREARPAIPREMCWLRLDAISDRPFADEQDLVALTHTLRQIAEFQSGEAIGPFGKPRWIEELFSWVQREIEPYGLRVTGNFRQLNASPTFSLVRLETNGQAVWFKAVGEPNLREFPISVTLSRLFPGFVPAVVATHPAWHGWITTEFSGSTLDEGSDACAWERTAKALAELQIASLGKTDELLKAGCRDLGVSSLLEMVDPFLEVMLRLMEQQQKTQPAGLDRGQLLTLGTQVKETLSELAQLNFPDTLGHLDFNPGNILCSADQCVFLDWAEGAIGHPFLTFQYLLEHLTRLCPESLSRQRELASFYAGGWEGFASQLAISRSLSLAPLAAVFAHAVSAETWRDQKRLANPQIAGYFRSLVRRMKREADALANRSLECKFA